MPKLYKKNYVTRKNDPTTQAIIEDLKGVFGTNEFDDLSNIRFLKLT